MSESDRGVQDLTVSDLLDAMRRLGRQVSFYPSLAKLVGIKEAILLQQLVYWTPKSKNERGWIYKSAEDLEEETSLSYREQQRVRATLRERGLIEERYSRDEHRLYFRVIREAVKRLTPDGRAPDETSDAHLTKSHLAPDETLCGTLPFVSSYKEQESTQKSTSKEGSLGDRRQDAKISAATRADDDESRVPSPAKQETQNPAEQYNQRVDEFLETILRKFSGRADEELLSAALDIIDQRAWDHQTRIASSRFFEISLENFLHDEREVTSLRESLQLRRELRAGYMPRSDSKNYSDVPDPGLKQRIEDINFARDEAQRTGRNGDKILAERKAEHPAAWAAVAS